MHDVFINYRTGDGDEAAAMIERVLSERFGKQRIFRAARSIPPGSPYPETLLDAVRDQRSPSRRYRRGMAPLPSVA